MAPENSKRPPAHLSAEERAVPWAAPWYLTNDATDTVTRELQREVPVGHALYGIPVVLVSRRGDCDDVLFRLGDGSDRYAAVHLTYTAETHPDWPSTIIYESLSQFVEKRLRQDVTDYQAGTHSR